MEKKEPSYIVGGNVNSYNKYEEQYGVFFKKLRIELSCVCVKSLQSCPVLCDSMDCSPPDSSVHGDSPGKNAGGVIIPFLQGIFSIV